MNNQVVHKDFGALHSLLQPSPPAHRGQATTFLGPGTSTAARTAPAYAVALFGCKGKTNKGHLSGRWPSLKRGPTPAHVLNTMACWSNGHSFSRTKTSHLDVSSFVFEEVVMNRSKDTYVTTKGKEALRNQKLVGGLKPFQKYQKY